MSDATGTPTAGLRSGTGAHGGTAAYSRFWSTFRKSAPDVGVSQALALARKAATVSAATASRWLHAAADARRNVELREDLRIAIGIYAGRRLSFGVEEADFAKLVYFARQIASLVIGTRFPSWLDRFTDDLNDEADGLAKSRWVEMVELVNEVWYYDGDDTGVFGKVGDLLVLAWDHATEDKPPWSEWYMRCRHERAEVARAFVQHEVLKDILHEEIHGPKETWFLQDPEALVAAIVPPSQLRTTIDLIRAEIRSRVSTYKALDDDDDQLERGLRYVLLADGESQCTLEVQSRRRTLGRAHATGQMAEWPGPGEWVLHFDRRGGKSPQLRLPVMRRDGRRWVPDPNFQPASLTR